MADRLCWCGCKQSIAGAPRGTLYAPECARQVKIERKRKERAALGCSRRLNHVINNVTGGLRAPNVFCKVCCGLPEARAPGRIADRGFVLDPATGCCRGCGLPPGKERIERAIVLSSSAGTALNHGRVFGGG